jgi:hypothetical protein
VVSIRDEEHECNLIDSMSINANDETTGVTSFVQEACTEMEVTGQKYVPSSIVTNSADLQDLKAYFSRPRLIASGTIATNSRTSFYQNNSTGSTIFTNSFPDGIKRLMGVYGVRFSLVYTLQVAATPFHQGLLGMGWQYAIASTSINRFARGSRPETITNLPHVRLDPSEQTMVTMKVPFLYILEFMPLYDNVFLSSVDYGVLSLATVLPVSSVAGISAPTYKVYVHLEDLEFFGASPMSTSAVVLQSGLKLKGEAHKKKKSPVEEESDATKRPISTTLQGVRSVVSKFRGVPLVSSYATTATWLLDAVSGTAKAFGYSKPTIEEVPSKMTLFSSIAEHNTDAPSQAIVMSAFASNRLKIDPQFSGTDIDEMSLKYVTSQFSQICTGSFSTSAVHATHIYGCNVGPASFWFRAPLTMPFGNLPHPDASGSIANSILTSSVMYWSSMFRLWRGGFKFRFTFAKTKHHAGRVVVSYSPNTLYVPNGNVYATTAGPEVTSSLLQPFGYSKIFDLKDSNVFEFEVPYTAPAPFTYWYNSIGGLVMSVIDPLQAPSVVSASINFLVEVCAADDYELAVPCGVRLPALPQGSVRLQSGLQLSGAMGAEASELTVGEKLNSIKQLIAIPTYASSNLTGLTTSSISLYPWFYHRDPVATVPPPDAAVRTCAFSYGGNAAACYTYARGGTDYHAYSSRTSDVMFNVSYVPFDYGLTQGVNTLEAQSGSSQIRAVFTTPYAHVRVPANQIVCRVPSEAYNRNNWAMSFTDGNRNTPMVPNASGLQFHITQPMITMLNSGSSATTAYMSRAAADDAMLGQYIGPPPVALPAATATAPFDPDFNGLPV